VYVYFLQHCLSPLMNFSERSSASAPGLQRRFAASCRKLKPRESSAMITWRWPFPCHGKRSITRCRRLKHIRLLSESRAVNRCRACSMLWDPKSRRRLRRHLVFGRAQPTGANARRLAELLTLIDKVIGPALYGNCGMCHNFGPKFRFKNRRELAYVR
jgi:hypothetical protein